MRTLKLTHEQIELLTQALGIAESTYTNIHKDIIHKLVISRGNNEGKEQEQIANFYHNKACTFVDLLNDIENSKLDV